MTRSFADDDTRPIEIDDNLAGAEMCPLDTAVFLAERKRIRPEGFSFG